MHNGAITYRVATAENEPAAHAIAADQAPHAQPEAPITQTPYARVGEDGVGLAPPHAVNPQVGETRVILFGPNPTAIAQSAEVKAALESGPGHTDAWTVIPIESKQNWGVASTLLVRALMDEHAVAIVALDRDSAHLSEQLALKSFVPVVALSDDRALTSANVPWIFRLSASTAPAQALRMVMAASSSCASPAQIRGHSCFRQTDSAAVAFDPGGEPRPSVSAAIQ